MITTVDEILGYALQPGTLDFCFVLFWFRNVPITFRYTDSLFQSLGITK